MPNQTEAVAFKKVSAATFATMEKDDGTFYRVIKSDQTEDLYKGEDKLNTQSPFYTDSQGYITCRY